MRNLPALALLLLLAVPVTSFVPCDRTTNAPPRSERPTTALASAIPLAAIEPTRKLLVAAAAALGALSSSIALRGQGTKQTLDAIDEHFPGTLTNKELVDRVAETLYELFGYNRTNTLLCTSLGRDTVTRVLEKDFSRQYQQNFRLGGQSGFPWGGVAAFSEMASHVPEVEGASVLIVYAPHVGVNSEGVFGSVPRRGHQVDGPCSVSALAAADYLATAPPPASDEAAKSAAYDNIPSSPTDAEQVMVTNALLPYAKRLNEAPDKMVELPYVLFEAQYSMMYRIIQQACEAVPGTGKIAALGGIQINTPHGVSDYFLPLSFEVYDNQGQKLKDLNL